MLRQPVGPDPKRFQLCRRQMPDLDDGYARHPELSGCENPAVCDHDLAGVVDYDWHHKPELADAVRDLIDLILGMLPRVTGIENEICDSSILNLNLDQAGVGRRVASSAWCGFRCSMPQGRAFGGVLIGGGHLKCSLLTCWSTSITPKGAREVYNKFAIIFPWLPIRHAACPQGLAQRGFLIGRPSICRARSIQANRTLRSERANLVASLYRACNVPGCDIVWLTNTGPAAFGLRLEPFD